jgi:predicted  nucleic acid-binding Zn-ribbon protein
VATLNQIYDELETKYNALVQSSSNEIADLGRQLSRSQKGHHALKEEYTTKEEVYKALKTNLEKMVLSKETLETSFDEYQQASEKKLAEANARI